MLWIPGKFQIHKAYRFQTRPAEQAGSMPTKKNSCQLDCTSLISLEQGRLRVLPRQVWRYKHNRWKNRYHFEIHCAAMYPLIILWSSTPKHTTSTLSTSQEIHKRLEVMGTLRATLSGEVLEARSQRFKKTMVKHRNGFLLQIASSKAWILCRTPTCSDVAAGSWAFDRLHKRRGQKIRYPTS